MDRRRVIQEGRSPIRDRKTLKPLLLCDPGLYLGTADLSIANESESISP